MKKVTLCPTSCCPTVEREGDVVTITDDDKNKVKMTYAQYCVLRKTEL